MSGSESEILRPAEFAHRAGVRTRVVVKAMYERTVPRVRLDDGTLGIPADWLVPFRQTLDRSEAPSE